MTDDIQRVPCSLSLHPEDWKAINQGAGLYRMTPEDFMVLAGFRFARTLVAEREAPLVLKVPSLNARTLMPHLDPVLLAAMSVADKLHILDLAIAGLIQTNRDGCMLEADMIEPVRFLATDLCIFFNNEILTPLKGKADGS